MGERRGRDGGNGWEREGLGRERGGREEGEGRGGEREEGEGRGGERKEGEGRGGERKEGEGRGGERKEGEGRGGERVKVKVKTGERCTLYPGALRWEFFFLLFIRQKKEHGATPCGVCVYLTTRYNMIIGSLDSPLVKAAASAAVTASLTSL